MPSESTVIPGTLEPMTEEECWRLLRLTRLGRIAFDAEGGPDVLPVNFVAHDDRLLFRTGPGVIHDAVGAGRHLSLQIDGVDVHYHSGWSVLAKGPAAFVEPPGVEEQSAMLPLEPWARGERNQWVAIAVARVTGRRLR